MAYRKSKRELRLSIHFRPINKYLTIVQNLNQLRKKN